MQSPRIYCRTPLQANTTVAFDDDARRHVVQVLRLKPGSSITLFDGTGEEYPATIQEAERKTVTVSIGPAISQNLESPLQIHLYQGISKGERMDYAIQKATELGVTTITPLFCERTVVKLDEKRLQKKCAHWQAVAISACEQCGRNQLPTIQPPQTLQQLNALNEQVGLLLNPFTTQRLNDLEAPKHPISLLIGPEGGLSESEIEHAESAGWQSIQLGPRILRTETATVVALTALQQRWGDL